MVRQSHHRLLRKKIFVPSKWTFRRIVMYGKREKSIFFRQSAPTYRVPSESHRHLRKKLILSSLPFRQSRIIIYGKTEKSKCSSVNQPRCTGFRQSRIVTYGKMNSSVNRHQRSVRVKSSLMDKENLP